MPAPAAIFDLVARFGQQLDTYKAGTYNETQFRRDFLDPFFKALGWDMDNEAGYAEAYRDVIHEDAIRIGGAVKAPDYCFRIGAYQFLLDWHRDWYAAYEPAKWAKGSKPALVQTSRGWKLTIVERKRILLNNLFGVDIDAQAVEVTKLSLLLKVLEGETGQALQTSLRLFHERALPDLGDNIKCGNSLIGADFFNGHQLPLFDDDERLRINVFDWKTEYPEIIRAGGFDAVVGNPPWGASFTEPELAYLREHYSRVIARMIDSYIYFIDRAIQIAKPEARIRAASPQRQRPADQAIPGLEGGPVHYLHHP